MNTDTKRHIDSARQVLVGVVPNPTSQIDQITNALIYKFMDDMDQASIKHGGNPSFFVGDLEKYAWTRLMDTRMGNQERMNLYGEALVKFSQAKQLPELFREIFKSAFLPYRSPETLGMFLKEIDYFDYSHPEELGNAYEYLLSIMSSQGDAGQFRTPRHIIDFIVDVVNPTKNDKVLDPACGTGGFLVSAYNHILQQHDCKNDPKKKEKPLTPDERKKLIQNFEGYDIDPTMVRISKVNMYLHKFTNPKIFQYDTLSSDDRWNDKFDVILANPPFMSPKGGIKPHSKFSIQSSRSEVLFVDYIMNHLRPKGRAGIIVPEGIIFQSQKSHTDLRKNLINDGLYAVVSLPSGIFNPYAGVKTSILLFNNEVAKQRNEILFVKIQNDGTDLGTKKRITLANDLPTAIQIIQKFQKGFLIESEIAHTVSKQIIIDTGDCNLSGDRYKVKTVSKTGTIPLVRLGEILEKQSLRAGTEYAKYEVYTISSERGGFVPQKDYYSKIVASDDRSNYKLVRNNWFGYRPPGLDIGTIGLNTTNNDLIVSPLYEIFKLKEDSEYLRNYLFLIFRSESFKNIVKPLMQGAARPLVNWNTFTKIQIPLPPLEIQEQIVAELNGYQNIIAGAKQIAENWKPKIEIDPKWKKIKLGNIIKLSSGKSLTQANIVAGIYPVYGGNGINSYHSKYFLKESTVVIGRVGAYCGSIHITTPKAWVTDNGLYITDYLMDINVKYLAFYLENLNINQFAKTGGQPSISQNTVYELEISFPSIKIQKQIVEKIEAERTLVESSKKLIELYEQKTKDVIAKLWTE